MNHGATNGPQPPYGHQPPPGFGPPPPQYAYAPPPQPVVTGPDFLAVDRHSSIAIEASGVVFEINGHEAEFPWPEVRSVHYKASPSGKSLMMAVVHVDGGVECVVDAKPRELLGEWFGQLPAVLGYYRPMG
ncbi:hypothetical protein [Streptomyces sp. V4I2]|uniref:hypothetical protein n=1 Tax=Streptomyces sp. V4I2 TaxID=3042280 RepID=UPI00277DC49A|nr:hypothetical protein [Streptomyces sp. V4I2]MDQ1048245.1 hypothetical protein [Streptomyces sp. V4I2]